ncbi:MAG: rhodanese-like domain-containing protein [Proteobacteria bacterium]|nr:rhodanese-like domain-containing protein [Pseudomonadota bacterium]
MNEIKIKSVNVQQLKKMMDENPELCLIDVRENDEWQAGHIPAAIHIPKDEIVAKFPLLESDKTKAVYLHCKAGVRSLYAAERLIELGYQEVYSVEGGILAWVEAGFPITTN